MECKSCAKDLDDSGLKFCSKNCSDNYIHYLEIRVINAMKNDLSHVSKMSHSE